MNSGLLWAVVGSVAGVLALLVAVIFGIIQVRQGKKSARPSESGIMQSTEATRDVYIAGEIINVGGATDQPAPPGLLPREIPDFTGRSNELSRLQELAGGGSAVVTAIDGTAGVGKTALAVHAGHMLLENFPDGHLYWDLRGYVQGQEAADPGEVLAVFLRRLGIPSNELPEDLEQQSGLFRQLLSSRRTLVILDNVATEAQVRPLLPGAGSSIVLITSRRALAGLEVDERINLDLLTGAETTELLTRLVGDQRAMAEPDAMRKVGNLCGRLPLAIRIAGQLLAMHRVWSISHLAELLADEQKRLDILVSGDREVRSVFLTSYRQLSDQDRRLFRLLGLYPGPDFNSAAAASLADLELVTAGQALDRLSLAYLIIPDASGRFRLHDLLRLFAREICLNQDKELVRAEALARLIDYFVQLAGSLDASLNPEQRTGLVKSSPMDGTSQLDGRQALAVFDIELESMLAVLVLASDQRLYGAVCHIAEKMNWALWLLWRPDEVMSTNRAALNSARTVGNHDAEASALHELGKVYANQRKFDQAVNCHQEALQVYRETNNRFRETQVLVGLGYAYRLSEQYDQAVSYHQEALEICRERGDRYSESHTLNNLGMDYHDLGKLDQAIACYQGSEEICREADDKAGEAHSLGNRGVSYLQLQQFDLAIDCFQKAQQIYRDNGDKHYEGSALINLGSTYRELRKFDQAITCYQAALQIYRETGHKDAEGQALVNFGYTYLELRKPDQAMTCFKEAAEAYRQGAEYSTAEQLERELMNGQIKTGRLWWRHDWWRKKSKS